MIRVAEYRSAYRVNSRMVQSAMRSVRQSRSIDVVSFDGPQGITAESFAIVIRPGANSPSEGAPHRIRW